jgi:hypothetical protein
LAADFQNNDFWETVIRWLIEHPEVAPVHHGPLIDYLHDQRYVPSPPRGQGRGQPRLAPAPPRPNLCLKGRSPGSLLRAVEHWHRRLRASRLPLTFWRPSRLPPLTVSQAEEGGRKVYTITELISSAELAEEGSAMGHCVASYRTRCQSGQSSIWSLAVEGAAGAIERLLTLEVWNETREVIQARGRFNRAPQPGEVRILELWAGAGGPRLSQVLPC